MVTFNTSPDTFIEHPKWVKVLRTPESHFSLFTKILIRTAMPMIVIAALSLSLSAQTDEFGDTAADPVKLFERGQSAHARGEFEKALEFYEQAIKVRPEFPEAEFQRGNALVSLSRFDEADTAFRRAITLKKNWSLPYSALGALLMRRDKDQEAATVFQQALTIDPQDNIALRMLSEIRLRGGNPKEALEFATRAIQGQDAPNSAWIGLAIAERANNNKAAARKILDKVLTDEPGNWTALLERADLLTDDKAYDPAVADLQSAAKLRPGDKVVYARLAFVYQQAGKADEAAAAAKTAGLELQASTNGDKTKVIGTPEEIEAANNEDAATSRPAIQKLIEKNPHSAMLVARLAASYRLDDPNRSLELFRRAAEMEPTIPDYAVGYAAALVRARRFPEAIGILVQVLKVSPQNYSAHTNLGTALYEAKRYLEAISEFEWVVTSRPEVVVAHYFIATSHDYLGEYPEALVAYEKFLASADPKTNQLEIEKVKLRLPMLQRQIQLGQGAKKKP